MQINSETGAQEFLLTPLILHYIQDDVRKLYLDFTRIVSIVHKIKSLLQFSENSHEIAST